MGTAAAAAQAGVAAVHAHTTSEGTSLGCRIVRDKQGPTSSFITPINSAGILSAPTAEQLHATPNLDALAATEQISPRR